MAEQLARKSTATLQGRIAAAEKLDVADDADDYRASRRPGGAVHRGMVWLLRNELRWLVELLVARGLLPPDRHIELMPTETWPVGEENRLREIRADLVARLWPHPPPEGASLATILQSEVIGLLLDFQNRRDRRKQLRLLEYELAYLPVIGRQMCLIVITFDERVAQWARDILRRLSPASRYFVLTPRWIPRSGPIDAKAAPRRALLEAMIQVRSPRDVELVTNALRALREFSGGELLIYREMLLSHLGAPLIMQARHRLEPELEADPDWADYVPTRRERESYLYVQGQQAGREQGLEQGLEQGERLGRARAVLDLLRVRGFALEPATEAAVLECHDPARLRLWLERALTIDRLDALFDD